MYNASSVASNVQFDNWNPDFRNVFQRINELLRAERATEPMDAAPAASIVETILMCLKFTMMNSLSHTQTANLFKLVNNIFEERILPSTRYLIDAMFNPSSCVRYHAVCPYCSSYAGRYNANDKFLTSTKCNNNINLKDEELIFLYLLTSDFNLKIYSKSTYSITTK